VIEKEGDREVRREEERRGEERRSECTYHDFAKASRFFTSLRMFFPPI
jgi:hypothetical protein